MWRIAWEDFNVFATSSNTRCAGTQCLQLHDILPLLLRQEGIHNDGHPRCIWCIRGHSCTGSHCQYQLIVACCNLFRAVVLCVCCHITIIVAIMVIMIVKWHWRLDAFNGITTLIVALSVTLGICSCVTRTMQISGCTRLVSEVLRTFRHQLCVERDVTAAFLPHQG